MIEKNWFTKEPIKNPKGCILVLPGRGGTGEELGSLYSSHLSQDNSPIHLGDYSIVGITPVAKQWYPLPKANNKDKTEQGIRESRVTICRVIDQIKGKYNLRSSQIVLAGFSAGGVMAMDVGMHYNEPLAMIISHSGVILNPENTPTCKHPQTPFLLTFNMNDECFKWDERYKPTLDALSKNHYKMEHFEEEEGGHRINFNLLHICFEKIAELFDKKVEDKHENLVKDLNEFLRELKTKKRQMEETRKMLEDRELETSYHSAAEISLIIGKIANLIRDYG